MAGITYNGAINVLPCDFINIPEPGVLLRVDDSVGDPIQYLGTSETGGDPEIIIDGFGFEFGQTFLSKNISGGDVIYVKDVAGGLLFPLQIKEVQIVYNGGVPKTITIKCDNNYCAPDTKFDEQGIIEFYRGNYNPTNGNTPGIEGYTGAGNSDGYALVCTDGDNFTKDVLTVNDDRVNVAITSAPLDLKVVKVYCGGVEAAAETCAEQAEQNYPTPSLMALKIEQ